MSSEKINSVLITGGAGYLGSVLTEKLLDKGKKVTIVDNLMYGQTSLYHLCNNPKLEFIRGDVRDENLMRSAIKNVDAIVPLAAIVGEPACKKEPLLAQTVNLDSIKLLTKLKGADQIVVFPNTNSGYGTQPEGVVCTEDTPLKPISIYGETKTDAEKIILDDPNGVTLRLATVFGMSPRMRLDLMVNDFVYKAVTQRSITIFEGHFRRNFVHIQDVGDAFCYALENSEKMRGQSFNLGLDSANMTKRELAQKISEYVPGFEIYESVNGKDPDKRDYLVSNQKLRDAGFEAKVSIDEGIKELIKGYKMIPRSSMSNV